MSRVPGADISRADGRIFVLGNAGVDIGLALPRVPRAGESLLGTWAGRAPGGKGLNQAVVAARAGAAVWFHAAVGRDADGDFVRSVLADEPFAGLALVATAATAEAPAAVTDFSWLLVMPDGENIVVGAGPCAAGFSAAAAVDALGMLGAGDLLVMQGNLPLEATLAALELARARGAMTMFNPAPLWWDTRGVMVLCDVVVANRGEAETITSAADPFAGIGALAALGVRHPVITLGAEGCLVLHDGAVRHLPAPVVDAVDTTGCGDTFCGVLAALLVRGVSVVDAAGVAQRAAGMTAARPGAFAALPEVAALRGLAV